MFEVIREYKSYLETHCRLPQDTVVNYLGNLPIIFDNLKINSLNDINAGKVASAWKVNRWEPINKGIQVSEGAQSGYLRAFKEFLCYLEERGYLGEPGVSQIINLPENQKKKLKGLSEAEGQKLREFLLFNVKNDSQRRETALMFILLSTGCELSEALALSVHGDGLIYTEAERQPSGDFTVKEGVVFVGIRGIDGSDRTVKLSSEVAAFLNFYLENRKIKNPILFLSDARSHKPQRLSESAAQKIVERVFEKAGIAVRKGEALQVLRCTALENGLIKESNRQIISLRQPEAQAVSGNAPRRSQDLPWQQVA
jgi:site-specific recombinase XerD